ncbi:MAG: hypothetical protein R3331_05310 [Sulfurospirillaceae bacterium]|nr:hypothetical protein [Sulfurospirillaceae bacterium]
MPFLLLMISLFLFALVHNWYHAALGVLIAIVASLLATYWKPFRDSLEEYF